jgi:hypothetical protein
MATVAILGLASPLPQAAFNPVPIIGASAQAFLGQPLSQGFLTQAADNPIPIIGANGLGQFIGLTSPLPQATDTPISIVTPISASVVALLFPNAGGGGSFGGPI